LDSRRALRDWKARGCESLEGLLRDLRKRKNGVATRPRRSVFLLHYLLSQKGRKLCAKWLKFFDI
jgi:hypothetical protein